MSLVTSGSICKWLPNGMDILCCLPWLIYRSATTGTNWNTNSSHLAVTIFDTMRFWKTTSFSQFISVCSLLRGSAVELAINSILAEMLEMAFPSCAIPKFGSNALTKLWNFVLYHTSGLLGAVLVSLLFHSPWILPIISWVWFVTCNWGRRYPMVHWPVQFPGNCFNAIPFPQRHQDASGRSQLVLILTDSFLLCLSRRQFAHIGWVTLTHPAVLPEKLLRFAPELFSPMHVSDSLIGSNWKRGFPKEDPACLHWAQGLCEL